MKKQIAGVLVATVLAGVMPAWAGEQKAAGTTAAATSTQPQTLRDSIDRAVEKSGGPQLTARERQDLETRHAALKTNPVARGAGGIVMLLLGTALSVGATAYFINKAKKDTTPPALAGH